MGFQSDTAAFDATLLLEDTTDSGLGHSSTTTTSKEGPFGVRLLEEPPAGKSLDVLDSAFDSSLAGIDLSGITSISSGGLLPSEIDPGVAALSTFAFEQSYKLPVPASYHAEMSATSLSYLLLDSDMAGKHSLRCREEILVPFKFRSPVAPSRSSSQFPAGIAARIPSKVGDTTVHLFHVLAGSIGTIICGGKIGSSCLQACVVDVLVGSSSCSIRLHYTKE